MNAFVGVPVETLKAYRTKAQDALVLVLAGENAQAQSLDGQSVTYTPTDAPKLRAFIAELTRAIGDATTQRRRPFRPYF